jgi:hypothetical protein
MSYVKEKIDKELLDSWRQETRKSLSSGVHSVWSVDKDRKSYLTFTGADHQIPSDPSEFMCDRYLFLYQNNVYKIEVHIQKIEGKLAVYQAKTFKPKPNFNEQGLETFSRNLDQAFTVFKSSGDIKLDMKTNDLDCHIMID